ncbi:aspartate/glutamate racemase family protein [Marinicella sp. S1101]|uniref:aspartate/glutamate racemase family protein n=1 Tax=Marinicella marina TaxID=2996016 RepID=UPI002260DF0F|nr:aspartate/glutamate racemase family protein [Marinicella marina]MCX7554272.1 aspartate/glutamate racemase family protein [Marinicella marina]MDJ1138737.1 aspartate/glutamate racemase family protein [Marinicella marina]
MKTIGLLGGMSWESTQVYYRELNRRVNQALGGLHSVPVVMVSVDFQPIERLMQQGEWQPISQILKNHCLNLQQAGAQCIGIATNTMHKLVPQFESQLSIPLVHIADSVAKNLMAQGSKKIGLLGTSFTMQEDFYKTKLAHYGVETLVPQKKDQGIINQVIFDELCQGQLKPRSKQAYLQVIEKLQQQGADAVVLACTEIGLLIKPTDTQIPLLDATEAHINDLVTFALSDHQ